MGFLDQGQSKVTAPLCSTAVSFRPSSRPRKNHAISLGQHHFYSCAGPILTVAPVLLPSGPSAQRRPRHEVDPCSLFRDTTPIFLRTWHSNLVDCVHPVDITTRPTVVVAYLCSQLAIGHK